MSKVEPKTIKLEPESDYIEGYFPGSIFGHADPVVQEEHADAVIQEEAKAKFVKKNFQRQGTLDTEVMEFDFSVSSETVKQRPQREVKFVKKNFQRQGELNNEDTELDFLVSSESVKQAPQRERKSMKLSNKLLQLSQSLHNTNDDKEKSLEHTEEESVSMSSNDAPTKGNLSYTTSKIESDTSTKSSNNKSAYRVASSLNSTKTWKSFIPKYKKINLDHNVPRETTKATTTINATAKDDVENNTTSAKNSNNKQKLNESSTFVEFHKNIESNSSMNVLTEPNHEMNVETKNNTNLPKPNYSKQFETKYKAIERNVTSSFGLKGNANKIQPTNSTRGTTAISR